MIQEQIQLNLEIGVLTFPIYNCKLDYIVKACKPFLQDYDVEITHKVRLVQIPSNWFRGYKNKEWYESFLIFSKKDKYKEKSEATNSEHKIKEEPAI